MFEFLLKIKFIRNWFFTLRPNRLYRVNKDLQYMFQDKHLGIVLKGKFIKIDVEAFVKESLSYFSFGHGADYVNLSQEERDKLLKYYEEQEDFEKCNLIQEVNNKIKFLNNGKN
jgi:hypothetical protein